MSHEPPCNLSVEANASRRSISSESHLGYVLLKQMLKPTRHVVPGQQSASVVQVVSKQPASPNDTPPSDGAVPSQGPLE